MRTAFALVSLLTLQVGCADDNTGDDGETYDCERETRDDDFSIGLEKVGNALDFKLMTADPAPPARDNNTWTVQINAMGGSAVTGSTLRAEAFMPDHGHKSPITPVITEMGNGLYKIEKINLWMPGLWETTIQASNGGSNDAVVYRFCIPN